MSTISKNKAFKRTRMASIKDYMNWENATAAVNSYGRTVRATKESGVSVRKMDMGYGSRSRETITKDSGRTIFKTAKDATTTRDAQCIEDTLKIL